jgi:hypothetical protein
MNHMFDDESREARFFSFDPDPHGAHVKILKLVGRDKKVLDVLTDISQRNSKRTVVSLLGSKLTLLLQKKQERSAMMLSWVT